MLTIVDKKESTATSKKLFLDSVDVTKVVPQIFFHLLDICVWNAYCLYKHKMQKAISMAKFQLKSGKYWKNIIRIQIIIIEQAIIIHRD